MQVFPEYTGALAFNYDKDYTGTDPDEVYTHVQEVLPDDPGRARQVGRRGQRLDGRHQGDRRPRTTSRPIADLKAVAGDLTLTAPPEFKERPQGIPGLEKTYGVMFGSFRPLTGQGIVQALKNGQADVANIYSTDPAIAANGFVQLEDTEKIFGSQNIVPLVRADRADEVKDGAQRRVREADHRGDRRRCSSRPTSTRRTPRPSPRSSSPPTVSADPSRPTARPQTPERPVPPRGAGRFVVRAGHSRRAGVSPRGRARRAAPGRR